MKQHPRFSRGFTLIELLITITIILVLAGVLVPLGRGMMSRSRTVNCAGNLRQIGLATMMYAGDNNMSLPVTTHQRTKGGTSWKLSLLPYISGGDTTPLTFKCHEDSNLKRSFTYLLNDFLTPNPAGAPELNYSILANIDRPQATLMFAEASPSFSSSDHFHFSQYHGGAIPAEVFEHDVAVGEHDGKANYLFADGHVETLTRQETFKRLAGEGSRFVDPSGL